MKSKSPFLAILFVALLLGASLLVFSHRSAKSCDNPFNPPPVGIYGYVTYSNGCQHTTHDTVWVYSGSQKVAHTVVQYVCPNTYKYIVEPDEEGSYTVSGFQGASGCATDPYDVNYTGSNRQDIEFNIAPEP